MIFLSAARAALAGQSGLRRILVAMVIVLAGLSLSCSNSAVTAPNHNAYVTLPGIGSVLLLHIDGTTGAITQGAQTPPNANTSPTGLALLPSKQFLYAVNSFASTISIFNVRSDGTLSLSGTPSTAGPSPYAAVIDPSGKYLLVTNSVFDGSVSVFSIDSGTGALSPVGSPVPANAFPTEILFLPSGNFVYVTNPSLGMVSIFSFSNSNGALTQLPDVSPVFSGAGASGLAVDASERFLYVTNPSAANPVPVTTIGNISGFNIAPNNDPNPGSLTPILGSPFYPQLGSASGPTAITVDPSGKFVYAVAPGTSYSIWCFTITPTNGQLAVVTNSPFSLAAGRQFALFDPIGSFFYIGSESANGIESYTYNPSNGALTEITDSPFSTGTPPTAPGKMVFAE
jgi:6-phosphogluconolactonase (cycloisomerase 2 family)